MVWGYVYENILENIHGAIKEALGNQEKRKNSKLWWIDEINFH
jgi:hypothetical protein